MINIKLFKLILTFSENDRKNLNLFIKSQDNITGRKYYPLFKELEKYKMHPDKLKFIPAEKIFENAYGGKKFSYQTISNRQSELLKLILKYFEQTSNENNRLAKLNSLYNELLSRNQLSEFRKIYNKNLNIHNEYLFKEETYKDLQETILNDASYYQFIKMPERANEIYFSHSKILLADILCKLYRTGLEFLVQKYYSISHEQNPILNLIESVKGDDFFESLAQANDKIFIIPRIRYFLFKCFQFPDEKKYIRQAEKIFFENEKYFDDDFIIDVYRMIMSYYIIKINSGETKFYENLYRLYVRKLKQNLVSDIKYCNYPANIFREYVITGIRVKKFKWVEKVIKKYSPLLPENIRSDEYSLAMIRFHFAKNEYAQALKIIVEHKSNNIMHYFDLSMYRLIIYYELKRYEEAYYEIDRIKHFMKNRNDIPEVTLKPFRKFINLFQKLLNFRSNPNDKKYDNLMFELKKHDGTYVMKSWLTEKVIALNR